MFSNHLYHMFFICFPIIYIIYITYYIYICIYLYNRFMIYFSWIQHFVGFRWCITCWTLLVLWWMHAMLLRPDLGLLARNRMCGIRWGRTGFMWIISFYLDFCSPLANRDIQEWNHRGTNHLDDRKWCYMSCRSEIALSPGFFWCSLWYYGIVYWPKKSIPTEILHRCLSRCNIFTGIASIYSMKIIPSSITCFLSNMWCSYQSPVCSRSFLYQSQLFE